MNEELKTHKFLKQKKIEKLDIATQEVFENFVDDVLILDITNERIKRAPNILYIGNLNEELANALGLSNVKVYMRKNELYHARKERKEKFVQDVPTENFKNLPNLIANANEAYIDTDEEHRNFFLIEDLNYKKENKELVATYHFNKDELGNYFVTARRIEKETLNQKAYRLVRRGIEPTHTETNVSTLPSGTSLTNSETNSTIKELESQVQELTQITIDTADIAPKASAMVINAYDKCGENALANTLINTISADEKVMQSVQREFENLIQQESEQSTQSVDEVAQTQQELDEAQILQQGDDNAQMILGDEVNVGPKGPRQ